MTHLTRPIAKAAPTAITTVAESEVPSDGVWFPAPAENPTLSALKARGLYKAEIASWKHDVTCPWVEEHTDAIDSGSAYFEPDDAHPVGGYKCQHSHGSHYRIGQLLKFLEVDPESARGKAEIRTMPGELNRVRRASERALSEMGGFYQSNGAIVTIRADSGTGDLSIELVSEPALTAALADAADWLKREPTGWVRIDPPARSVQMLHRATEFPLLPPLRGLARQPFLRDDRSLVTTPGYDPISKRYAAFDPAAFPLPKPTEVAAREALDRLGSLLAEFRFASHADRSAALSAMLTAAIRPALTLAPAFNITASTPGSGKSYLASTIAPLAGPGTPLKMSYPADSAEATKAMLGALQPGPAVIVFDDMQSAWVPHSAINRMLTSDTITDRMLGTNRTMTVGTRTLIMGTGNNVAPVRDMNRRVVTVRLHHNVATPALERYAGNPVREVMANRGSYVSAALTIVAAWIAAGSPRAEVPSLASFEEWSDLCRQPLLWLGLPDPATSTIEQLNHDPDQDALAAVLRGWHRVIGERSITLRDLMGEALDDEVLQDALEELPVTDRGVINRHKLGWYLKHNARRVIAGFMLEDGDLKERKSWRVVTVEAPG